MTCLALLISAAASLPLPAGVAVLELRSNLTQEDRKRVDAAALAEKIRDIARRTVLDAKVVDVPRLRKDCNAACELSAGRDAGAGTVVTGDLLRAGDKGFLVSLELRDVKTGRLVGSESALGTTPEELTEAVAGAAVDLFKPARKGPDMVAREPQPPAALTGEADQDADAGVLIAYDHARTAEARGKEHPEEPARAWAALAGLGDENPFRDLAAARAALWTEYAETQSAFQAQLARETARLQKILPLATLAESRRLELLVRYARSYGVERGNGLVPLLPAPQQERARIALACEAGAAASCLVMAHAADDAHDAQAALEYLDRACTAGANDACAVAGDRLLAAETRDVARAITLLQRGCSAGAAAPCARLARVYEEGDGTDPSPLQAASLREKACNAGDGGSCRRMACTLDSGSADQAALLWQKGCKSGDAISCALASVAAGEQRPAPAPAASPAPKPAPVLAVTQAKVYDRGGRKTAGYALLALSAVAGSGAVLMSMSGEDRDGLRRREGNFLFQHGGDPDPHHMPIVLGAAALLSGVTGLALVFGGSDDEAKPAVGVAPTGLVITGKLP